MASMCIGRAARLANVNVQTLRYYERKGLVPKPLRRPSGYREYPAQTIGLVKVIKFLQGLGFSLREIKELLALRRVFSTKFDAVIERVETKIKEIDDRINELSKTRNGLEAMLKAHHQDRGQRFGPILDRHVDLLARQAILQENNGTIAGRNG
jgi:MerR family copper efflux transcriptional regulator